MSEKRYLRADIEKHQIICRGCGKKFFKNNDKQIVFFCSPSCRNKFRKGLHGKSV